MKLPPSASGRAATAFTIIEVMVSTTIVAIVIGAVVAFTTAVSRSVTNISNQTQIPTDTASSMSMLAQRIRLANFAAVDTNGNTLTLAFDDDLNTDSNTNGNKFDDRNHYESFQFHNTDGSDTTTKDNRFIYKPNTNLTNQIILLTGGVRKLPGTNVFSLQQTGVVVNVNLGVLDKADGQRSQTIEIRTTIFRRNR